MATSPVGPNGAASASESITHTTVKCYRARDNVCVVGDNLKVNLANRTWLGRDVICDLPPNVVDGRIQAATICQTFSMATIG